LPLFRPGFLRAGTGEEAAWQPLVPHAAAEKAAFLPTFPLFKQRIQIGRLLLFLVRVKPFPKAALGHNGPAAAKTRKTETRGSGS